MKSESCPYHGVIDLCLPMAQVLERLAFLNSPKDTPPTEPTDEIPIPMMPTVPPADQSLAFLIHGINTWGRTMIDDNLRPVTSGPLTADRLRALSRSLDDLGETVRARSDKGKEAKAWAEISRALDALDFSGESYKKHWDVQMFTNCLYFERALQIWTSKIAKLSS